MFILPGLIGNTQRNCFDKAPAGGVVPTTLNPSDKSANTSLSGGNLIATKITSIGFNGARAIAGKSSGKYYCEMTITTMTTPEHGLGISNSSWAFASYLGQNNDGCGVIATGQFARNGGTSSAIASTAAGDVIGMAVDLDAGLIWFRKNNGNWNSALGAGDPAAGSLGRDISGLNAGPYYPTFYFYYVTSSVVTFNFGGSAYTYTPPVGFGNWGT